jgi:murein L,D-transpeptidase YcbB/YkuD
MIKRTVFSTLGVGLLGLSLAFAARPAAAEVAVESSPSGAKTTYFGSSSPATPPAAEEKAEPAQAPAAAQSPTPDTSATATPAAPATPTSETPAQASTPPTVKAPEVATPAPPTVKAPEVATPAPPPVNPVVEAIRAKLADKSFLGKKNSSDDVAAAADYYGKHTEPLWIKDVAYTTKAKAIIGELKKADDWGLESKDFVVAELASGASAEAQGAAEAQLTLSALKYARYARGGRIVPVQLSNILDMQPPVKDPKAVMTELADASHPGAYLRGLNPHHEGFERLRQALLKARGPQEEESEPVDPALLVKLPNGKLLRPGAVDDQVLLLRKRLKVVAENSEDDRRYDDALVDAVRGFQKEHGLRASGYLNNSTRAALNNAGEPEKARPKRSVDLLIANMERWRWLPADLGRFYVMNNIPEFTSEIWKDKQVVLKQKMVDGQPSWPTPILTSSMKYVIFHPNWGMPNGIKVKELLPRLQRASGGGGLGFFDQLFNGGESGGAQVLEAYDLQVSQNGRPVDANSINWNNVDIRRFDFIQPPGPKNPLGKVKFRFPNRHDVYMHDTPERGLFAQSQRALSHGCMRIEEPRRTAEVILAEDKGWPAEK